MFAARRFFYLFRVLARIAVGAVFVIAIAGCDRAREPAPISADKTSEPVQRNRTPTPAADTVRTANPAWPVGTLLLEDGIVRTKELNEAVTQLLAQPSIEKLEQAQRSWRYAAAALEGFHLFSRLGSVAPQDFRRLVELQYNLTAWPIQPGYLDGFGDHPYSGIVFDVGIPLTAEVLREQHGMTDNSDATLGVYAMEFLLFGEQNNRGPLVFQPITALDDKYRADGFTSVEELPRNRRRELLRLQAQLLTEDVVHLRALWTDTQPGQLQHRFEVLASQQQSELLQKAALALATEQLVTLSNSQPTPNAPFKPGDLWQAQQMADRFAAQLQGLQKLNTVAPLGNAVEKELIRTIDVLRAQNALPPLNERGLPNRINWQPIYESMRDLVKALNPPGQPELQE